MQVADTASQLEVLRHQVDASLTHFQQRRQTVKRRAAAAVISRTALSGAATVLLGVRGLVTFDEWLASLALIASAVGTVVAAWDGHWDHRALWIQRSEVVSRLEQIQRELELFVAGATEAPTKRDVEDFRGRYEAIMADEVRSWRALRGGGVSSNARRQGKADRE